MVKIRIRIVVFWIMTPCRLVGEISGSHSCKYECGCLLGLVGGYQCSGGIFQGRSDFCSEDRGDMSLLP
jgi:hypothetical protein